MSDPAPETLVVPAPPMPEPKPVSPAATTPAASPPAAAKPASSSPTDPAKAAKKDCNGKDCSNCLSGGSPHKKSVTSGLLLLFIGIATILGALLIQQLRTTYSTRQELAAAKSMTTAVAPDAEPMAEEVQVPEPAADLPILAEFVLPDPELAGTVSVEQAIANRRSKREFESQPITQAELAQMLWAGQGVTNEAGNRAAPSARAVYPYTLLVAVSDVTGLEPGVYSYLPDSNSLGLVHAGEVREQLIEGGIADTFADAPVMIFLAADFGKMAQTFPDSYKEVTLLEGGHIGQNMYLEAVSLGLGMVTQDSFESSQVLSALDINTTLELIYGIPVGVPAAEE